MNWTNKKYYMNGGFQITVGKLIVVLSITLFQFFGMLVDNNWSITSSMFFLFSNAFLILEKSSKMSELERESLIKEKDSLFANNASLIRVLEYELKESKILITELRDEVKGLKKEIVDLKQQVKDLQLELKRS